MNSYNCQWINSLVLSILSYPVPLRIDYVRYGVAQEDKTPFDVAMEENRMLELFFKEEHKDIKDDVSFFEC